MISQKTSTPVDVLQLHPSDNICIAVRDLAAGVPISIAGTKISLSGPVKLGHKIALKPISKGESVRKFGQIIGSATSAVNQGDWVHSHNLAAGDLSLDYAYSQGIPEPATPIVGRTFMGYRRANGKIGTRNYLAIISSVNCSASVSKYIAHKIGHDILQQFPNVDGVIPLTHKGGCAMQYDGEDHHQLERTLAGYANHPNIGGYLLVGLGCETGTIGHLMQGHKLVQIGGIGPKPEQPPILHLQDLGGTRKTVEAGVKVVMDLLPQVNNAQRVPVAAAEIILGLECGGSDGNSGVTANPTLGYASDMIVAAGGTSILSEIPEIYGAEHLLTRRAISREVGKKLIARIDWWKNYTGFFGVQLDNNPSPGNKAGGLTTIYEKSLGAVAKGGTAALSDVCLYAEAPKSKGLIVMDTPGYDPASVTGLVAGGTNVVAFTTGRGSCFGCKPVPSIKIATNTPMYERMIEDMDFDAGRILSGMSLEDAGRELFELILAVAGGQKTKSELLGIGDEEFVPWSIGPVL